MGTLAVAPVGTKEFSATLDVEVVPTDKDLSG